GRESLPSTIAISMTERSRLRATQRSTSSSIDSPTTPGLGWTPSGVERLEFKRTTRPSSSHSFVQVTRSERVHPRSPGSPRLSSERTEARGRLADGERLSADAFGNRVRAGIDRDFFLNVLGVRVHPPEVE